MDRPFLELFFSCVFVFPGTSKYLFLLLLTKEGCGSSYTVSLHSFTFLILCSLNGLCAPLPHAFQTCCAGGTWDFCLSHPWTNSLFPESHDFLFLGWFFGSRRIYLNNFSTQKAHQLSETLHVSKYLYLDLN